MSLLVDAQLPSALTRYLAANGLECTHVQDLGLASADDRMIWEYARAHNLAIVTKGEDFQAFANRQGRIPPQVVWVRLGNCRTPVLLAAFSKVLPAMRDALVAGEPVVEIR
jgi:predicted nuclease of predicted toxin-antitoxin system